MPVRSSLLLSFAALAVLALSGCKKEQQAAAPAAPRDCCCKVCPTDAAPVAKAEAPASPTVRREVVRVVRSTPAGRQTREARSYRTRSYAERDRALAGGDYYASGATTQRYKGGYTGRGDGEGYVTSGRRYERYEGDRADSGRRYAGEASERGRYEAERSERERYAGRRSTSGSYEARGRYEEGRYQTDGYGGRYGASGRTRSGVSISVEESESSSERVRYRESSSSYGSSSYAGGSSTSYVTVDGRTQGYTAATGYYEDRQGRVRRAGPAGVDRAGYLTWPGKVED